MTIIRYWQWSRLRELNSTLALPAKQALQTTGAGTADIPRRGKYGVSTRICTETTRSSALDAPITPLRHEKKCTYNESHADLLGVNEAFYYYTISA